MTWELINLEAQKANKQVDITLAILDSQMGVVNLLLRSTSEGRCVAMDFFEMLEMTRTG